MNYSKKIFKLDSKGNVRVLHVYTEGADLVQESGLLEGSKVEHRSTCTSKNVGRANETTPESQAEFEARAKIQSKMSEGYFDSIEEATRSMVILPMLAKDFKKESHKVKYPCYVQPKLDGMRALYNRANIISRKGKLIETINHITEDIGESTHQILDGELYAHGISFQENMKLVKKYRPGETERVMFHVYDLVSDKPFSERIELLHEIVENNYPTVKIVETYLVSDEAQLKNFHQQFIGEGYEGTIVRHSNAGYAINKRDTQLLKYKDFIDEAYEVVDIVPSDKNPEQGVIHCKLKDGRTFGCGMKFSHSERETILMEKKDYIGQIAEIRFFEYTDDGLPRFPVCVGFRNDK